MKNSRWGAIAGLFLASLVVLGGCDVLVAPTPFGAPADSAGGGDDTGPAAPNEPTAPTAPTTDGDGAAEPGVTIAPTTIAATEGGADGSYTVVLNTAPSGDVDIAISSGDQVTTDPTALTFTTGNWDTAQTVTVSAVDDAVAEGLHTDDITHAVTSGDAGYDGLSISDVAVQIADNDVSVSFADNRAELGDVNATLFGSPPADLVVEAGGVVTLPGNETGPFLRGYTFRLWNTAPDGSGTSYNPGNDLTVNEDTELYAQWLGGTGNPVEAFSGGNGSALTPYLVSNAAELYNVGYRGFIDEGLHFEQTADIDLGVAPWNEGDGWPGVGSIGTTGFNATFDGNGHRITNLTVYNRFTTRSGLFTGARGATILNVALENVDIQARRGFVGAILGSGDSLGNTTITDSYATGTITVDNALGGGTPSTDDRNVGGLVGYGDGITIIRSFADVTVSNTGESTGGLAGYRGGVGSIQDSYALGDVTGLDKVGGLLGEGGAVERSYSVGVVLGSTNVGGLVGSGSTDNESFYNSDTSGQTDTTKGAPRTTAQMLQESTFTNWDFAGGVGPWAINENASYPYHQWYTGPVPTP